MCGIAGAYNPGGFPSEWVGRIAREMATAISYRGPDDSGEWVDGDAGIAMAHRRLSILDLSPAGHQPMVSSSGRYVIVFNGEIYNHLELRADLGNHSWRGHSDTETLLAAIERWGLETTLKKSIGMFALGLWDRQRRDLVLGRDRLGEKPLYYGWQGDTFLFGSELKSLKRYPEFSGEIDRDVITLLLRHGYIPAPYSIYRGVRKLMPGTVLHMPALAQRGTLPEPESYWSLTETISAGQVDHFCGNADEAILELETRLSTAVRRQMRADVPLGAFLSGGIDSSTVVALMQAQSSRPIKTFTVGFAEQGYNEGEHAKVVARHLGTDHAELYIKPRDAMEVIPRLPTMYDEPFGDSSAIPIFLVSQLARQHVTVSISGDGGDELFCGYARYPRARKQWEMLRQIPGIARRAIAYTIPFLPSSTRHAYLEALQCVNDIEFYKVMTSQWQTPIKLVKNTQEPPNVLSDGNRTYPTGSIYERLMYADTLAYLPNDILVKIDRAAMAMSLETRLPLLDHQVVEFAWALPIAMKMRDGQGKWILRQVLNKYVPRALTERPKMGFGVPVDHWLRGPLQAWAEELLAEDRLQREGYFHPELIRKRWQQHVSGRYNWRDPLWLVLMFQAWLDQQRTDAIKRNEM